MTIFNTFFLAIFKFMKLWTPESIFNNQGLFGSANLCRIDWYHFRRPAEGFRASAEDCSAACFPFSCCWKTLRRSMKNLPPTIENYIFLSSRWLRFEWARVCWKRMPESGERSIWKLIFEKIHLKPLLEFKWIFSNFSGKFR